MPKLANEAAPSINEAAPSMNAAAASTVSGINNPPASSAAVFTIEAPGAYLKQYLTALNTPCFLYRMIKFSPAGAAPMPRRRRKRGFRRLTNVTRLHAALLAFGVTVITTYIRDLLVAPS
jgi:hypothetical protein